MIKTLFHSLNMSSRNTAYEGSNKEQSMKIIKHCRYGVVSAMILLLTGCASTQSKYPAWIELSPDITNKNAEQLAQMLNETGKQRFNECKKNKEKVFDFCFMYAYFTTDTENNAQIYPFSFTFWDFMRDIGADEYIPAIRQLEVDYINAQYLNEIMKETQRDPKKKSNIVKKKKKKSSKTVKSATSKNSEVMVPRTEILYQVEEDIAPKRKGTVIKTKRVQVNFELPGE